MKRLKQLSCFQHVKWNPDRRELRGFAKAMPIGFALLGLLALWRKGYVDAGVAGLWIAGAALAVAALIPGLGRYAYLAVYLPSSVMGHLVSQAMLAVLYWVVFVPIGLALRAAGKDPLSLKRPPGSMWLRARTSADYYRQF